MCPQQPKAALQDVSKQRALDQTTIVQRDEIFFRPALRTAGKTLSGTSVVHAIPGRIRLRVPSLRFSPHLAKGLVAFLKTQAGVTGASVNIWCHSVTVTCDPLSWTADDLCALLQTLRQEDVEQYELDPAIDLLEGCGMRHFGTGNYSVRLADGARWLAISGSVQFLSHQSRRSCTRVTF